MTTVVKDANPDYHVKAALMLITPHGSALFTFVVSSKLHREYNYFKQIGEAWSVLSLSS
jgi:hypothetical protein